jgi:hypothetical protein
VAAPAFAEAPKPPGERAADAARRRAPPPPPRLEGRCGDARGLDGPTRAAVAERDEEGAEDIAAAARRCDWGGAGMKMRGSGCFIAKGDLGTAPPVDTVRVDALVMGRVLVGEGGRATAAEKPPPPTTRPPAARCDADTAEGETGKAAAAAAATAEGAKKAFRGERGAPIGDGEEGAV